MTQNTLKVKDYVNLFVRDEHKLSTGVYEWRIPASYYSNRQSSVCTVSIPAASVRTVNNHGGAIIVSYQHGGHNTYNTRQVGRHLGFLSHLQSIPSKNTALATDPDNSNTHFYTDTEQVKLAVVARPERIALEFMTTAHSNIYSLEEGVITLCFEYYDSVETSKQYHEEFTRTL